MPDARSGEYARSNHFIPRETVWKKRNPRDVPRLGDTSYGRRLRPPANSIGRRSRVGRARCQMHATHAALHTSASSNRQS
jgi:hypothetical protein